MVAFTGKIPKNTYKDILQVSNSNAGVDATIRNVSDAEGTASALALSTTQVAAEDGAVGAPGLAFTDDPDNGLYRIGTNNWAAAVAGAKALEFNADGAINMALQPAFLAEGAAQNNVTGNATLYTIIYGTEIYDQNADFDATSTFTAPVTGRYAFGGTLYLNGLTASATLMALRLVASNRTFLVHQYDIQSMVSSGQILIPWSMNVDMDAADTATVAVAVSGEASDVVDVAAGTVTKNVFWGRLAA